MTFQQKIRKRIGDDIYAKLDKEANNEVSLALKMPLKYEDERDRYYQLRNLIPVMISECELFEKKELRVSPADIINVLFRCKLLFAVKTDKEYLKRAPGGPLMDETSFFIPWNKKSDGIVSLIDEYLDKLESLQKERTLISEINSFNSDSASLQVFFDQLFEKLKFPFSCYVDEAQLIDKHKKLESGLKEYSLDEAKKYFCAPSLGFTTLGTSTYCFWHASAWLRTFLCLLKISGFLHPGQIDFGVSGAGINPPLYPVFLGSHSKGCFCWEEDKKESWEKVPDGCLFRSFGYRGISNIWLDTRNFGSIEKFFLEYKKILDLLKNPWDKRYLNDIASTLDILSSATQIPDLGAKVLLIYCCLEHLFVPKNIRADNKKYIVGGINALRSDLLEWFDRLYKLRCDYAHKVLSKETRQFLG
jgi:hypothetical protein